MLHDTETVVLGIRIPNRIVAALDTWCAEDHRNRSNLMLRIIVERLVQDGLALERRQFDAVHPHLTQLRERQRENDMICVYVMAGGAAGERAGVPAEPALAHCLEPFPQANCARRQCADELCDQLVVAVADVPLLVRGRQ